MSYKAYAVLGCKIPASSFLCSSYVQGCTCDYKDLTTKVLAYCPVCGAVSHKKEVFQPWLDGLSQTIGTSDFNRLNYVRDNYGFVYVGEVVNSGNSLNTDFGEVRKIVRDILNQLGLWDEKNFGLHSVLYHKECHH